MKFNMLKQIADLRDQFENLTGRHNRIMEKSGEILDARRQHLDTLIRNDFSHFFTENGFQIEQTDESSIAVYKSVCITLKSQNPGRRTEDIPCLLRYRMSIAADQDESHTIFVQPRNGNSEQNSSQPRSDAEKAVIAGLTATAVSLSRFVTDLQHALQEIPDESRRNILMDLQNRTRLLQTEILSRREELEKGSYVLSVAPGDEEWNHQNGLFFETLDEFLQVLDSEPAARTNSDPQAFDHLTDSAPFIG